MARGKKAAAEPEAQAGGSPLDLLRAQITKTWGQGVLTSAASILDDPPMVVPVGPSLDMTLAGGIPEGSWASINGPPKVGKTTTILSFAANCQRAEYGGRRVWYFNIEKRLKRKNLTGIRGLDTHPDRFIVIESTPELILSGEDHLNIAINVLQTDPGAVVILDSVSALVQSAVLDGGLGTETRGGGAKALSQFIDIVASVVPVRKSIVLGVTHQYSDTSGRTQGKVEKAASHWLYQADVRLKATWAEPWVVGASKNKQGESVGGKEIGKKVHWTCVESALGPPAIRCVSHLRYGVGVDRAYELFEMARAINLIEASGTWYELSFLAGRDDLPGGKVPRAQGAEKTYALLAGNEAWQSALEGRVREFLADAEAGACLSSGSTDGNTAGD